MKKLTIIAALMFAFGAVSFAQSTGGMGGGKTRATAPVQPSKKTTKNPKMEANNKRKDKKDNKKSTAKKSGPR